MGILIVNTVHLGGLEYDVSGNFTRSQSCSRIGRKIRVSRARYENDDSARSKCLIARL